MAKKIILFLVKVGMIFLIGAVGGIWGEQYLLPYLSSYYPLDHISWLKKIDFGTTIINQTKKEFIVQDQAISEIINNVSPSIVGLRTIELTKNRQNILTEGSGLVSTSDGLIITSNNLLPNLKKISIEVFVNGKWMPANLIKRLPNEQIAVVKIDQDDLFTPGWEDVNQTIIGEKVILLGFNYENKKVVVDVGLIKSQPPITLSFKQEPGTMTGGAVFNLSGKVIGLISVQSDKTIQFIPARYFNENDIQQDKSE